MSSTKVKLRQRELPSGKITLYLDYYPPVRNPRTMKMIRHEYLGIFLVKNPRTMRDRDSNNEFRRQAEAIRSQRQLSIVNEQFGFLDKTKQQMSFLDYFHDKLGDHDQKWARVYSHFEKYVHGACQFSELTPEFCDGFRQYLLNASQLSDDNKKLSQNSAAGYWSTFRGLLALAYREKYITENPNNDLDKIDTIETRRQYLTMEELQNLANTPCDIPVLKSASLFSCLTGLRISDILALKWENMEIAQDGGHCIRLITEKTDTEATLPISQEAYELCGVAGTGIIFKDLKRTMIQRPLKKWLKAAGITKSISFHCFRHTFATLQIAAGTNLYVVSKMLTHKNISTTQIYADVIDKEKREAAESIKLKK